MRITELFDNGQFVVTAEVGPPKGCHMEHVVEEAKEYLSGITAVNITDNLFKIGSFDLPQINLTHLISSGSSKVKRPSLPPRNSSISTFAIRSVLISPRASR